MAGPEIGHTDVVCPGCGESVRITVTTAPLPHLTLVGRRTSFVRVTAQPGSHTCPDPGGPGERRAV